MSDDVNVYIGVVSPSLYTSTVTGFVSFQHLTVPIILYLPSVLNISTISTPSKWFFALFTSVVLSTSPSHEAECDTPFSVAPITNVCSVRFIVIGFPTYSLSGILFNLNGTLSR